MRSYKVLWRIAIESLAEGRRICVVLLHYSPLTLQRFHAVIVHSLGRVLSFLFWGEDSRRLHWAMVLHLLGDVLYKFHFQVALSFSTFDLILVHKRRLQLGWNASVWSEWAHSVAWELPASWSIASRFERNSLTWTCLDNLASVVWRLGVIAERLIILCESSIVSVDNLIKAFQLIFAVIPV